MKFLILFLSIVTTIDATCFTCVNPEQEYYDDIKHYKVPQLPFFDRSNCNCRIGTKSRVVGGSPNEPHSIPWLAMLTYANSDLKCGGTIINSKLILTSKQCMVREPVNEIRVSVGVHDLNDPEIEAKKYEIENVFYHNQINKDYENDIAILELKTEIQFEKGKIEPGCFDLDKHSYGKNLLISGYGATVPTIFHPRFVNQQIDSYSNVPKSVDYSETNEYCYEHYVCVEASKEGEGICTGDEGGPLHYIKRGLAKIVGVVFRLNDEFARFGPTNICDGPATCSRLSFYKFWFKHITSKNYCSRPGF